MHKLFKDSRPALALVGAMAVALLAMTLVATANAAVQQTTKTSVSGPIEWKLPQVAAFAVGAQPKASAKVKTCKVSRFYDGRRIIFSGRMERFSHTNATQGLQMRFDVYRKYREHRKYRKVKGTGLGTWLPASDPNATVYVRELELEGVETAAHYKARVAYRWMGSDGSVEFKRVRNTKPCHQRVALPNLSLGAVKIQPIAGSANSNYVVTVTNRGASEAINVPVSLTADANAPSMGLIASIGPGQSTDVSIQAPLCRTGTSAVIDPAKLVRLRMKTRPVVQSAC